MRKKAVFSQVDGKFFFDGTEYCRISRTRGRARGEDYRWFAPDTVVEVEVPDAPAAPAPAVASDWRTHPATARQVEYLVSLGVQIEERMTKGRASQLIEAAKTGALGAVGGFYTDGSN